MENARRVVSTSDDRSGAASSRWSTSEPPPASGVHAFHGPPLAKSVVRNMLLGLTALGVDVVKALAHLQLPPTFVDDIPDDELGMSFIDAYWAAVRRTTEQSGLGLRLGEIAQCEHFGVFGRALSSSATLGDALLRAARFVRIVAPHIELSFYVEGERAVLTFKSLVPRLLHEESVDFILAAIGSLARGLTGEHLLPLEVRFAHPAPASLEHHRRLFESSAVAFSRPHNGYVFDSSILNRPVRSRDSDLCAHLDREAELLLSRAPRIGGLSRRVQETIGEELHGGNPSAEHVAQRLSMHPKTLSRRLKAEGTSHQQLLDQLRYRLAERYLSDRNLSIGEIAFLLGYSDTSSFNKAFKRWTGGAPQRFRHRSAN